LLAKKESRGSGGSGRFCQDSKKKAQGIVTREGSQKRVMDFKKNDGKPASKETVDATQSTGANTKKKRE